jgi:chaperonin GroEL
MCYDDENLGVSILRRSLDAPMRKIAANAGQDGAVIIDSVRRAQTEKQDTMIGYDVMTGDFVNMITDGIIDPAKVTRGALENAASIAAMILTTEALITDTQESAKALAMSPGSPGMDY